MIICFNKHLSCIYIYVNTKFVDVIVNKQNHWSKWTGLGCLLQSVTNMEYRIWEQLYSLSWWITIYQNHYCGIFTQLSHNPEDHSIQVTSLSLSRFTLQKILYKVTLFKLHVIWGNICSYANKVYWCSPLRLCLLNAMYTLMLVFNKTTKKFIPSQLKHNEVVKYHTVFVSNCLIRQTICHANFTKIWTTECMHMNSTWTNGCKS